MAKNKVEKHVGVRVPESLHKAVRLKLAAEDTKIQGLILSLLEGWVSGKSSTGIGTKVPQSNNPGVSANEALEKTGDYPNNVTSVTFLEQFSALLKFAPEDNRPVVEEYVLRFVRVTLPLFGATLPDVDQLRDSPAPYKELRRFRKGREPEQQTGS